MKNKLLYRKDRFDKLKEIRKRNFESKERQAESKERQGYSYAYLMCNAYKLDFKTFLIGDIIKSDDPFYHYGKNKVDFNRLFKTIEEIKGKEAKKDKKETKKLILSFIKEFFCRIFLLDYARQKC